MAPSQRDSFDASWLPAERLILAFNDVDVTDSVHVAPDDAVVRRIVEFGRACRADEDVLVHCWMGVSRSPAAAYVMACERSPGDEVRIADELRRASPTATPNKLVVALADDLLSRNGRLVDAIAKIGRGREVDGVVPPFELRLGRC
ncbi:tyrosine phosphatase family protein [Rhodopseudomonas sp.]|uniref:tyrosine phosphatase family protein n=1 Tax=Rhodopseudomonas sp. TaxID=1078 RepID=UPI003B3B6DBA